MKLARKTIFSADRKYRYTLWREFRSGLVKESLFGSGNIAKDGFVQFIGLNPSTADEKIDDPTIRRCIGFAKSWGFGALCMTNLFAFRATLPKDMKAAQYPIGRPGVFNAEVDSPPIGTACFPEHNDAYIFGTAREAGLVIAAWGRDGFHLDRQVYVTFLFRKLGIKLHHLGLNGDGTPKHPLYLKKTTQPTLFV